MRGASPDVVTMWLHVVTCGDDVVTMWLQSERRVRIAFRSRNQRSSERRVRIAFLNRKHLPTGALPGDAARFVTHAVTNTLSSITHAHSHQRSSAVISRHQSHTHMVISGHQRSSALIRRHQSRTHMVSSCCESRSVCFEHERASPKSQILSLQLRSTRMLPGLRSRWTTLHRCR